MYILVDIIGILSVINLTYTYTHISSLHVRGLSSSTDAAIALATSGFEMHPYGTSPTYIKISYSYYDVSFRDCITF